VAGPFDSKAASPRGNLIVVSAATFAQNISDVDFARNISDVDFAQDVPSNLVNAVSTTASVIFKKFSTAVANVISAQNDQLNFLNFPAIGDNANFSGNVQQMGVAQRGGTLMFLSAPVLMLQTLHEMHTLQEIFSLVLMLFHLVLVCLEVLLRRGTRAQV